jgi:hypothetical protein
MQALGSRRELPRPRGQPGRARGFERIGPVRRNRGQPPTCPADRTAPEWANRVGIYCMLRQFTSNFSTGDLG